MRFRGEDHSRFGRRGGARGSQFGWTLHEGGGEGVAAQPSGWDGETEVDTDAESELVRRLRTMEWPKPPPGVKERCLRELMAKVEEMKVEASWPELESAPQAEVAEASEEQAEGGGFGDRYFLTRRATSQQRTSPARQSVSAAYRPPLRSVRSMQSAVRLASTL